MTRIFDALRKAQAQPAPALTPLPPMAAPAPPPAAAAPSRPGATRPRAAERHAEPVGDDPRGRVVAFEAQVTLPEDVMRELTALRMNLDVSLADRTPRIVALLSAQGGEGTSTVAAQFGLALAHDGRLRTLLVDTHVRRPAPWLRAGAPAVRPIHGASEAPESTARMDVLPLDPRQLQAGVLSAGDLRVALDVLGPDYDWILLDGPPVLDSPDAATIAALADGILVVVQAGRTKRPVLGRAVDVLRKAGGNVLGSVLNRRRMEIPEFIYRRI